MTEHEIQALEARGYFQDKDDYSEKFFVDTLPKEKLKKFPHYLGLDFTQGNYAKKKTGRKWKTVHTRSVSNNLLVQHLLGDTTIALPGYTHSKYLIFDIDKRSQAPGITADDCLNQIKKDFGKPGYQEYSISSGGYHLYYHLKEYLTDNAKKYIEQEYLQNGLVIEIIKGNKKVRLPYSPEYKNNAQDMFGVKIESLEHLYNTFETLYTNNFFFTTIPWRFQHYNKQGISIAKTRESLFKKSDNLDNRFYGNGTRHIEQIKIGFDTLRGKGTFEDFVHNCETWNDGTSKDMKLPYNKKISMLKRIWHWCSENFNDIPEYTTKEGKIYDEFGNETFLNTIDFTFNSEEYKKLEQAFTYYYRLFDIGKIGGKKEEEFIFHSILLAESIWSKALYDEQTKAQYQNTTYSKLSKGTLFNSELKKLICESLDIPNYKKIWKFLEDIKYIQSIFVGKYNYSYKGTRFAKHYKITRTKLFYNQYLSVKNFYNSKKYTPVDYNDNSLLYTNSTVTNKKNINYDDSFFQILTDGRLNDRLLKVRLWKENYRNKGSG